MDYFQKLDTDTQIHSKNTETLCIELAHLLGLNDTEIMRISIAAKYHDVGKVNIPEGILFKPGKLSEEEYSIMKHHVDEGYRLTDDEFDETIRTMILYHHENEDGSGYHHLHGEEIPLGAKIIHICDVFEALSSERPYRSAWKLDRIRKYIKDMRGVMFEPSITDMFLSFVD